MPLTTKEALLLHNYYNDTRVIAEFTAPERRLFFNNGKLNWGTIAYAVDVHDMCEYVIEKDKELSKRVGMYAEEEDMILYGDEEYWKVMAIFLSLKFPESFKMSEEDIIEADAESFRMPDIIAVVNHRVCPTCNGQGRVLDPRYSSFGEDYEEEDELMDAGITFTEMQTFKTCVTCQGERVVPVYTGMKTRFLQWAADRYLRYCEAMDDSATYLMEARAGC